MLKLEYACTKVLSNIATIISLTLTAGYTAGWLVNLPLNRSTAALSSLHCL